MSVWEMQKLNGTSNKKNVQNEENKEKYCKKVIIIQQGQLTVRLDKLTKIETMRWEKWAIVLLNLTFLPWQKIFYPQNSFDY